MKKILLSGALIAAVVGSTSAQTTYLSEDFEGGFPADWASETLGTDGGWNSHDAASIESAYFTVSEHTMFVGVNEDECNCDHSATRLVSAEVDLSAATTVIVGMDFYFWEQNYGGQEVATLEYSTDGGTTWMQIEQLVGNTAQEVWQDGLLIDASATAGNSSVWFSVLYNDGTGWNYGVAVDNFKVFEPVGVDVEMSSLSVPAAAGAGTMDITGTITNLGTNTLDDVTITWNDGSGDNNDLLTGLGLGFGDTYNFTHATQLNGMGGNTYDLTVSATAAGDANQTNDTLWTSIEFVDQVGTRLAMVENFSSSTCPPCEWLSNSGFDGSGLTAGLGAMNANDPNNAEVSIVKYQVNWPGDGDHAWNADVDTRRGYYGVSGAPTPFTDGAEYAFNTFNSGDVATHQDDITFHDVSATHSISGTDITVNVTVDPYADADATLHIAVLEKEYEAGTGASFSNGETEFHHIMRKMLPSANGTSVSLTAGTQYTTSQSYSATVQPMSSFDLTQSAGTFAFHEGSDVEVVVWLQAADKSILNSAVSVGDTEWETGGGSSIDEYADNTRIAVFPNPATNGQLNLMISTIDRANAVVTITDMTGAVVMTEGLGMISAGTSRMNMNIESLANGLYNVNVLTNGHVSSTKIMVK